jgi:hypothetical protein
VRLTGGLRPRDDRPVNRVLSLVAVLLVAACDGEVETSPGQGGGTTAAGPTAASSTGASSTVVSSSAASTTASVASSTSSGQGGEGGGGSMIAVGDLAPDFMLVDVNPASPTANQPVSPRDYLQRVSGWYFGHAT